jgi:hypothetical protein
VRAALPVAAALVAVAAGSGALQPAALNAPMVEMEGAIQHNFTPDRQENQQINQQEQNFAGQVENFDDVLNSQQLVQDPTEGQYYKAPYDSHDQNGPNGPGYYLNGHLLNPMERQ